VAQAVEHLHCKCKALSSLKKKKKDAEGMYILVFGSPQEAAGVVSFSTVYQGSCLLACTVFSMTS
jgi:hypothetical protein